MSWYPASCRLGERSPAADGESGGRGVSWVGRKRALWAILRRFRTPEGPREPEQRPKALGAIGGNAGITPPGSLTNGGLALSAGDCSTRKGRQHSRLLAVSGGPTYQRTIRPGGMEPEQEMRSPCLWVNG